MRHFLIAGILVASAWAEPHVVSWTQGDLDGDGKPERAVIVCNDTADPGPMVRRELRIYKRRGAQFKQVYRLPIDDGFTTQMAPFQLEDPDTLPWGLNLVRRKLYVVFAPNSGHLLIVRWNGKGYEIETTGD